MNRIYVLIAAVVWSVVVLFVYRIEMIRDRAGLAWISVWLLGVGVLVLWALYRATHHRMLSQLRGLPLMDDLTGLNNRRAFYALTRHQLDLAEKIQESGLLLMVRLDNLAFIIDAHGKEEGENAIIRVAQAVLSSFRGSDVVARYDYDRFAAFLPKSSMAHRDLIVKRFWDKLYRLDERFARSEGFPVKIGLTQFDPVAPMSLEKLIGMAEEDMGAAG